MFNVQVLKESLMIALNAIESTVGNNGQNLGDDCVAITDTGNNSLELYTTNSIEFSRVVIILTSGSAGKAERMPYVNFKRFKTMIDSIPDKEYITIKATVNDIELTYGTRKKPLKLAGSSNGMIPLPTTNGVEITINKDIIESGLNGACSIIKDDNTSVLTNCIRIDTNNYDVEITAADVKNSRMFLHKCKTTDSNTGDVLVEANKFKKAFKLFADFKDIVFENGQNIIKISGSDAKPSNTIIEADYFVRALAGNYPKTIANMFTNVTEYAVVNKDEIKASLLRINAIEDTVIGAGTLDLSIDKDIVNIVKKSQYGTVEDSFNTENEISNPIRDTFKAKSFAEVIKNFTDNGSYGTPNTFEIGKSNINANGNYYVLKETGMKDTMFLIAGFNTTQTTP